ncbi:ABC transporter substrate-binding protein [Maledivibacter halophilus]|uniref:Carbohydrate ABC transporter substrate-binding protein, CUT1 family (TC 3.A.1.1.-) n=1 Tax=Maledivibacter halophilus TaxID=36842 RepID=A0A1T5LJX8_9FIRM|nr:ABC transporter substrate-binding protein [Maledivibacter halophilus]SKC76281.1 carbohydrate ABC transporter substrate-binding protein, CUT1 family (TC 3.A.1.1.-) [Maledivibacter halophilus]
MKRILTLVLSLVILISLTACGGGSDNQTDQTGSSEGDVTVINFFHRWPNEPKNTFFNELVAEFEKQHPNVKIKMDKVLNDPYKEKLRVLVSSDDLPDVFVSWSDSFAKNIVSSGKVKAIDYLYKEDSQWAEGIMETQIKPFQFNGKTYGAPLTIDGKAFFYNKDVFSKYDLKVPTTFEELIDILEKLKTNGYESPIIEGLSDSWAISHYLGTMNQRMMDPEVINKDYNPQTCEFTDLGYIKVLERFKTLTDYMGTVATAIDHETARNMFASGEVPIVYMQFAEIKMVEDAGDINFGFFDFPKFKDGKGNPTALTGAPEGFMLGINAPQEAEEFLKFIISKENAFKFTKECGQFTALKEAVTEENATKQGLEAYKVIMNASETAPWLDNAVNIRVADAFMRGGQSLVIGEMTPEEVMENVQKEAAKLSE